MTGTPTRALVIGQRFVEEIRTVVDTGERRTRWMPANDGRVEMSQELALVHVDGEAKTRWIAASRLEPSDPDEHVAWLAEIDVVRPRVVRRVIDVDDDRRASRRRYEARLRERRSEDLSDPASVRPTAGRYRSAPRGAGAGAS